MPTKHERQTMRELPITFCQQLIPRVYDRTKTETRRIEGLKILNEHPEQWVFTGWFDGQVHFCNCGQIKKIKPRYRVGDECWIKEGFRCTGGGSWKGLLYRADGDDTVQSFCGVNDGRARTLAESLWSQWDHYAYETRIGCGWRSSRFMPKWASRGKVRILQVKDPERVSTISEEDCIAEGIIPNERESYTDGFHNLWDSLHTKPDERFEHGPWEFPYVFELIEEPK